ncbi:carbohydrate-binding X8 domain superfamily protein [Striga asiatica]|uniref:Carbohydrate-binding X8 domain superfamily protein n=1 Tax=Striga asiatica TaxID=4170 RepID=A0A5A7Q4L1_STRAF|nr:carbohydrate-binding X8 domain superfamily protein [Striga asiatica]
MGCIGRWNVLLWFLFLILYGTSTVRTGNQGSRSSRQRRHTPPPPTVQRRPIQRTPPLSDSEMKISWCVARPEIVTPALKQYITSTCKRINCSQIKKGKPCYFGNDLRMEASYLLSCILHDTRNCNLEIGDLIHDDPSTGKCKFPRLAIPA